MGSEILSENVSMPPVSYLEASAKQQLYLIRSLTDIHLITKNQVQTALSKGAKISAGITAELPAVATGMLVPEDQPLERDITGMLTLVQSALAHVGSSHKL